jgi:hypothetical protein
LYILSSADRGDKLITDLKSTDNGMCVHTQQMPNGGLMTCRLDENFRKKFTSQDYSVVQTGWQKALDDETCQITGYEGSGVKRGNSYPASGVVETEGDGPGQRIEHHPNGQKAVETNDRDGNKHGKVIRWDENGKKISEENFFKGKGFGKKTFP